MYGDGVYKIVIKFPDDYPQEASRVKFLTPILHPKVSSSGNIKLYEWSSDKPFKDLINDIYELLQSPLAFDPNLVQESQKIGAFNQTISENVKRAKQWVE